MLYDRLAIPVPPTPAERDRWMKKGWKPDRLDQLLRILGDRAFPVLWDKTREEKWRTHFDAGTDLAIAAPDWAFAATRTVVTQGLPRHVTGIEAVTNYASLNHLKKDLKIRKVDSSSGLPGGTVAAIVGREFLLPNDPRWKYEDLLKVAVELSSDEDYVLRRANFWRWHREFLSDGGITDQAAVDDAVKEMRVLVEDERQQVRKSRIRLGVQFAFMVGTVTLGMMGGPLTAVAAGAAFLSIAQFAADRLLEDPAQRGTGALLHDTRRHFGWK